MGMVIQVENLSKQYRIGNRQRCYKTLRESLTNAVIDPLRRLQRVFRDITGDHSSRSRLDTIWALKDVSFEVKQGEVVGIIGRNGAGKTTLLKILSRITEPTEGYAEIHGRVGSLLEVGTGFHHELTGRENIYLNGAILGMKKAEIDRKFDEIVAFSEVERFIDTPLKRYSSGMQVRLAFAVAAYLEPEILLVDEVLAVGDAAFQKKCLGKIGDVTKQGRTVLFVSHNMAAVNTLCEKSLLLDKGELICEGKTQDVINSYLKENESKSLEYGKIDYQDDLLVPIQIKYLAIKNEKGEINREIKYQESFCLELGVRLRQKATYYYTTIALYDSYGHLVVFTADDDIVESQLSGREKGTYVYTAKYHSRFLKPGEYFVEVALCEQNKGKIDTQNAKLSFEIQDQSSRRGIRGRYRPAVVAPEIYWELKNADNNNK